MPCSFRRYALPAAIAAFVAFAAPAQAQLIQHRDIPYAMALTIVTGALDACKAMG